MLNADENVLVGAWVTRGSTVVADDACRRIETLVVAHLVQVARSPDGWSTLYRDPNDNRLWQHTYPNSHLHGGGPPALHCISPEQATDTYGYEA